MTGVSVVIPLRNGAAFIRETLTSVWAQNHAPLEIIVVDDGSTDRGTEIIREVAGNRAITIVRGEGRGAAAAINKGLRRARYSIVCQIDQDVVLGAGWIAALICEFDTDDVAAVQGIYVTDPHARLLSRVMGRDLEERYAAIHGESDHVCTGNVAYRLDALRRVGFLDEQFGYGYDNDLSYRLRAEGYRLIINSQARSFHRWREDLRGYFRQQYGFGYGRLDIVAKHPKRVAGDAVSPTFMMLHPVLLLLALLTFTADLLAHGNAPELAVLGVSLIASLLLERTIAGVRAAFRFGDLTPLWFPLVHLVRDIAWVCAIVAWVFRRLIGEGLNPAHSMEERTVSLKRDGTSDLVRPKPDTATNGTDRRALIVIPAFNEARNLRAVVDEINVAIPGAEILVVDDGSTDDTEDVVSRLDVRTIQLPQRMGIGTAMRVAIRYALRQDFNFIVRLDGDGQHRPEDVKRLLEVVRTGQADIAFGCRGVRHLGTRDWFGAVMKRPLAACLSFITGRRVLDPTCGLSSMGPRALRLLSECHPTGYPEPELRLLISRTSLVAVDVDIIGRPRLSGRTSLTPLRMLRAAARVALALCVTPFRPAETELLRD